MSIQTTLFIGVMKIEQKLNDIKGGGGGEGGYGNGTKMLIFQKSFGQAPLAGM